LFHAGCRESIEHGGPDEVLHRVLLDYPSVLGYARVSADRLTALLRMVESAKALLPEEAAFMSDNFGGKKEETDYSFVEQAVSICREGSHVILVFLDPTVFGGPLAFFFEPTSGESLVRILEADEAFERVPGSDPPEFSMVRKEGIEDRIMGLLGIIGFEPGGIGASGPIRIVVEEIAEGTLVIPSYDVRRDFSRFLRETSFLSAWGDTGLVINIEVHRLTRAYAEDARRWRRNFSKALIQASKMIPGPPALKTAMLRTARYLPELTVEALTAVEGIRYVSETPWGNGPELCLVAYEDGCLIDVISSLEKTKPDMLGFVPQGLAIQWSSDPHEWVKYVGESIAFYSDTAQLDQETARKNTHGIVSAMSGDTGRYLWGAAFESGEGFSLVSVSALPEDEREPDMSRDDAWPDLVEPMFDLVFTGEQMECSGAGDGIRRYEYIPDASYEAFLTFPPIETVRGRAHRITTMRFSTSGKPGGFTKKLARLEKMGAGKALGFPGEAEIFLKFSMLSLSTLFLPGIENIFPTRIMAYGAVEENRLVFRFL